MFEEFDIFAYSLIGSKLSRFHDHDYLHTYIHAYCRDSMLLENKDMLVNTNSGRLYLPPKGVKAEHSL